jgi:hypothetical protein
MLVPPDKPSIAVLAFNNMSGDPEQSISLTASLRTYHDVGRAPKNRPGRTRGAKARIERALRPLVRSIGGMRKYA